MKRFWFLVFLMAIVLLAFFGLATALDLPFLGDDQSIREVSRPMALILGISLLATDVLLPVPSSLIMITNGALFGIFLGALLSLTGSILSILIGWFLGKSGQSFVEKFMGIEGLREGKNFLDRWGNLAIVVSRPIPVLAETVSVICGSMSYPLWKTLFYGFLGLLPTCLLYAYTGHLALTMESSWQSFLLVVLVAATVWLIGVVLKKKNINTISKKG